LHSEMRTDGPAQRGGGTSGSSRGTWADDDDDGRVRYIRRAKRRD
jgi:hypothetical protein